jgi:YbbR domain-containing protein
MMRRIYIMKKKNNKSSIKIKKKRKSLLKLIFRGICKLFIFIYNIFDKFIITPIAKGLFFISKLFKITDKPFDRLLSNKPFLITLSLGISLAMFFVVDNAAEIMRNKSTDIIYGEKITALYNQEAYVVEGLPDEVDISLIGRRSDLYLAKQYPSEDVVVDLRKLAPGTHEVELKYSGSVSSVDYKLDPSVVTVIIYEKISQAKSIEKEILYEDKLDTKYTISDISFSRDEVYVKSSEYKLDEVAVVKALIDVSQIDNPSVSTTTLKDVPLFAYDSNGEKLDVEIVPSTIDASIKIESPSKEVALRAVPQGDVIFGKAIESIVLSDNKVKIYGDADVIADISYLPVKIDVSGLDDSKTYKISLSKPNGVREISEPTITAEVTLSDITEKTIEGVGIATKNLGNGLSAQAASESDISVDVIVKGTSVNVKSITSDNISAAVNLQGLTAGIYDVDVIVSGDDLKLSYTPKKASIKIVIKKA